MYILIEKINGNNFSSLYYFIVIDDIEWNKVNSRLSMKLGGLATADKQIIANQAK